MKSNLYIEESFSGEIPTTCVSGCGNFSVAKTFDCGQTFRFSPSDETATSGIAFGQRVTFRQTVPGSFTVIGCTKNEFESTWRDYLDLDTDYGECERLILDAMPDEPSRTAMEEAVKRGSGIHILRQDPWEITVTFLLSQNNNIPRIRSLVDSLCQACAKDGDTDTLRFPSPEDLLNLGEDGLFRLKTGYRAAYLYDAAVKVADGRVNLYEIAACDDYEQATERISQIKGVGPKVASCILLFGFHKTEAFPVDVWMKRALARRFPGGFDPRPLGEWQGLAQQYLFYAERWGENP